ncbi:MAG: AAA family ATPase [Pseudomonadota bacterium]
MYLDFFNFHKEPFNNTPDPAFLFLSHQHEEAIEALMYGINNRKGFIALIGDIGTGKTTICRALLGRLGKEVDTSVIFNPMLSVQELLEAVNDDFGNKINSTQSVKAHIDALNDFLLKRLKQKKNAVIVIDEAQHLSVEAFEMLRMLSNLETEQEKLLQIVFIGQKELEAKLRLSQLRQLNQRIAIRNFLCSLKLVETVNYILHRLTIASSGGNSVHFDGKALRAVYEYTKGVPREINKLCDRSLLAAYVSREYVVTRDMVDEAISEIEGRSGFSGAGIFTGTVKRIFSWLNS